VVERGRGLILLAIALVTLAACAGDPSSTTSEAAPSSADRRANLTVLESKADLPDGWASVPPRNRLEGPPGKPVYCGVSAEPDPLREGRLAYYEQASTGRAMLEYGMLGTTETATGVLDALIKAAPDCSGVSKQDDARPYTQVKDLPQIGDQSVAWDTVSGSEARSRVLVFRADDTVVVLVAFGTTSVPITEQTEIARTLAAALQ